MTYKKWRKGNVLNNVRFSILIGPRTGIECGEVA